MQHIVHNERAKLQATLLNNAAVATFAGAIVQTSVTATVEAERLNFASVLVVAGLLALAVFLHRWAMMVLERLKEPTLEDEI
jgi:hypothetical protein